MGTFRSQITGAFTLVTGVTLIPYLLPRGTHLMQCIFDAIWPPNLHLLAEARDKFAPPEYVTADHQ
jgi:hypothetical protein